tara:strand:- start:32 stop:370 length:339 start_codon:yes stop_codon:yes gene_type:complete
MGGENASNNPQGSTVLNLGLLETMYTLCPESRVPVDNAIRTGMPCVSEGKTNANPSRPVERIIIVVVRLSWFEAPSITALISLYPWELRNVTPVETISSVSIWKIRFVTHNK